MKSGDSNMIEQSNDILGHYLDEAQKLYERVRTGRESRSIMFTDVTGSTAFFESRGDFDGLILLRAVNEYMVPIIDKFGGRVVKSLGDGLLADFPDAPSACRAAVAMQQRTREPHPFLPLGTNFSIVVGIHSGEIFRYRNDVFGDVINVAARMAQLAGPSTILISQSTRDLIDGGEFVVNFASKAAVKGKSEPLKTYSLTWKDEEIRRLQGKNSPGAVRAFVATVNPHRDSQFRFIDSFGRRLLAAGVEAIYLKEDGYDKSDPIGKALRQIDACDIAVILGLERSRAYYTRDKEPSPAAPVVDRKYTSGWLQMEAGIAFALKKPIFVLADKHLMRDGIFDSHNNYPIYEFDEQTVFDDSMDKFFDMLFDWVDKHREEITVGRRGEK